MEKSHPHSQNLCPSKAGCLPPNYQLRMIPVWKQSPVHTIELCPRIVWVDAWVKVMTGNPLPPYRSEKVWHVHVGRHMG